MKDENYSLMATIPKEKLGDALKVLMPFAIGMPTMQPIIEEKMITQIRTVKRPTIDVGDRRLDKVVLGALSTGPCSAKELQDVVEDAGYARASAGSVISDLVKRGLAGKSITANGMRYHAETK